MPSNPADGRERPTVKQVYALAAALCQRHGESFPETRSQASETIERLRNEGGGADREASPHRSPEEAGQRR
jgi:hypothetical protein